MGEFYDLRQFNYCIYFYIRKDEIFIDIYSSSCKSFLNADQDNRFNTSIIYDKETKEILRCGDPDFENHNENHIQINNFMDGLSRLFKKDKVNWNEDEFLLKSVSDFMRIIANEKKSLIGFEEKSLDEFNYAFIVPSEWEEKIREEIIRPIFIQADLILEHDRKERLLFYTDVECMCYFLQAEEDEHYFKRGRNTLLCRLTSLVNNTILIRLNLIQTTISLFNFSNSKLFSKVLLSDSLYISQDDIIDRIKLFLQKEPKLSDINYDKLEALSKDIYYNDFPYLVDDNNALVTPVITDTSKYELSESQTLFIKSIRIIDICHNIDKDLMESVKYILSTNLVKEYRLLIVDDQYSSEVSIDNRLFAWIDYMLECDRLSLNSLTKITRPDFYIDSVFQKNIISGAGFAVTEAIQSSNMYCLPRIMFTKDREPSSSAFKDSAPNAILNIDILFKSTLISYSLLDNNGLVEEVFDNKYFAIDKRLPSLDSFYSVLNTTTLNINQQFIRFAEQYLLDNFDFLSIVESISEKKEILSEIENILNNGYSDKELVSTKQKKYITAFLLMYIYYIREAILCKLPVNSNVEHTDIKIGYAITVEKIFLKNVIGTKDDFRKLIFASGLLPDDDPSKKLRIMVLGEGVLPVIQQSLNLEFLIRANFVLAQLHEDYIQLTLNQVIANLELGEGGKQNVILQDEIIPIQNIYDSFCLNMWNTVMQNKGLFQLCEIHKENNVFDISLKTKQEFTNNFKQYISDKIFNGNSNLHSTDSDIIRMNNLCSCKVCFTVNEIINVCIKPVLQEITIIVLSSLINNDLFGIHTDIEYLFSLVHFNNNPHLQDILADIMEETAEYSNPTRGIDTSFSVVPKLTHQLLQSTIGQKPSSYHGFCSGTLYQVFSPNYSVLIIPENIDEAEYIIKDKISDIEGLKIDRNSAFRLFKEGDIMNEKGFNKIFYLESDQYMENLNISIVLTEFKSFDGFENTEPFYLPDNTNQTIGYFEVTLEVGEFKVTDALPIMVSVVYQCHTSSLLFTVRIVGEDSSDNILVERGELMTLDWF